MLSAGWWERVRLPVIPCAKQAAFRSALAIYQYSLSGIVFNPLP